MKLKRLLSVILALVLVFALLPLTAMPARAMSYIPIDEAHFPNETFRYFVTHSLDPNEDGMLIQTEIDQITAFAMDYGGSAIDSLQGIEFFTALERLSCKYNHLTTLDLSKNTALVQLDCSGNQLTSLDVSSCTALTTLNCSDNAITSLSLSSSMALQNMDCSNNQLPWLNLSEFRNLVSLKVADNPLTDLDCRRCSALQFLDVHDCTTMTELRCFECALTNLNVTGCTALETISAYYNELTTLNVSSLTSLKYLNLNNNLLSSLDISHNTALESLFCEGNKLMALDVSNNTALEILSCASNQLSSLDISKNTNLLRLYCSDNRLSSLNVRKNTGLRELYCHDNQLTKLDISNCRFLCDIYWNGNRSNENTYWVYKVGSNALTVDKTTEVATTFVQELIITTQPQDVTVAVGASAVFQVAATGAEAYQWQYSTDHGTTWKDKSGATADSYTVIAKETYDGVQYRCMLMDAYGQKFSSNEVALHVTVTETAPAITTQPKAQTAAAGETATFKVVATGGNLKYQWQYSTDYGKTWHDKAGSTKATHTVTVKASYNGYLYRCVVTNSKGTVTSSKVRLTVSGVKPKILSQPAAASVDAGASATFKVVAAGVGMSYQWQYSSDGSTWKNKSGATSASYTVTAKASYDGLQYRCKVTNSIGSVTSAAAKLTVKGAVTAPTITTQPKAATAAVGETATFKVVASGTGLSYQWQYSSDYGKTWHDKAGSTKATHTVTVKASYNGYLYRCKVTNSAGTVISSKVRLTVSGVKPKILSQPAAKTAAAGESVTFKVVAAGVGMTYQWQYKTAGSSTWKDKTGATSASYTVTAKESYNGIRYRCVVTNSIGSVTSEEATLTVK